LNAKKINNALNENNEMTISVEKFKNKNKKPQIKGAIKAILSNNIVKENSGNQR